MDSQLNTIMESWVKNAIPIKNAENGVIYKDNAIFRIIFFEYIFK